MRKNLRLLFFPVLLMLGACAEPPTAPPARPGPGVPDARPCNAAAAQFAQGRPADAGLQAAALERSGARSLRLIRPGEMVTMEFNSERLNLELDAGGRVARVRCG